MNKKLRLFAGAIGLTLSASGFLQAEDAESLNNTKTFQAEDIFELEVAGDPQVSPDGKHIVYVRRSNDVMTDSTRTSVWMLDAEGGNHRPLLADGAKYSSPRWSPDGTRIAYMANSTGSKQIYVRWMDTGQTALLTNVAHSPGNLAWSPDGEYLAFTMSVPSKEKPFKVNMPTKPKGAKWSESFKYITKARYQADGRGVLEPAYTHVFVVPSLGGTARQLTSGNYHHRGNLSWSAQSDRIFFSANRSDNWEYETTEADIYAISLKNELDQLTRSPGMETSPKVSPDGKRIAYTVRDDKKLAYRNQYLHVMDIDSANSKSLTAEVDNRIRSFQWRDNDSLYFQQMVRGETQVDVIALDGEIKTAAQGLGGESLGRPYTSGSFHAASGTLAFTKGRHDRPADVFAITKNNSLGQQLTFLNEDSLAHKTLASIQEITYSSSIDGEEIQGWYLLPPDFEEGKKYPLIVEIHGGPHLAYGPQFSAELQRMAAEGYIVFYDNHRGSTGYGERFALLLQGKYSSEYDFADHMSGVDALIDTGLVDPEQLYITGGSAGGIATAYAIGLTDRFRAAVVAKPVINWLSKVLTADSGLYQIPHQFPGMPWEEMEHYWKRSPLSLVGNVTTPTLLITGEQDKRTPMSETEQFYQALKLRKVDTVLVKVPGSSHGIASRPSRLIGKVENILAWFEKYRPED